MTCNQTPNRARRERLFHVFALAETSPWPILLGTHRAPSAIRACTLTAREARQAGTDIEGYDLYAISAEIDIAELAECERRALAPSLDGAQEDHS